MPHYFAYGSNLWTGQMRARCPSAEVVACCSLPDWQLSFVQPHERWGGGVAGIVRAPGERVLGMLYRLSEADLRALDGHEPTARTDGYWREEVEVELVGAADAPPGARRSRCWVYIGAVHEGAPFAPSLRYLQTIVRGAREHGLPEDYIAWLQAEFPAHDAVS